jgi:hypothetical protein
MFSMFFKTIILFLVTAFYPPDIALFRGLCISCFDIAVPNSRSQLLFYLGEFVTEYEFGLCVTEEARSTAIVMVGLDEISMQIELVVTNNCQRGV